VIFGLHVKRLALEFPAPKCSKALETFHLYWKYICRNIQGGEQYVCRVQLSNDLSDPTDYCRYNGV